MTGRGRRGPQWRFFGTDAHLSTLTAERTGRGGWVAVTVVLVLSISACGTGTGGVGNGAGEDDADAGGTTITVLAAASLTDAFTELATAFEAAHGGISVALNFGGSSSLRVQILAGAPADVFASANTSNMAQVVSAGAAEPPTHFATNQLEIAVPAGNPAAVTGLADFAHPELLLGLCAEEIPCGQLARLALTEAGIASVIDTNEPDVRALLTKVEAGELDAGIVYRSDVLAAGDTVEGIDIPAQAEIVATYPIARLAEATDPGAAGAFVAFVLTDEGQAILASYGFGPP